MENELVNRYIDTLVNESVKQMKEKILAQAYIEHHTAQLKDASQQIVDLQAKVTELETIKEKHINQITDLEQTRSNLTEQIERLKKEIVEKNRENEEIIKNKNKRSSTK